MTPFARGALDHPLLRERSNAECRKTIKYQSIVENTYGPIAPVTSDPSPQARPSAEAWVTALPLSQRGTEGDFLSPGPLIIGPSEGTPNLPKPLFGKEGLLRQPLSAKRPGRRARPAQGDTTALPLSQRGTEGDSRWPVRLTVGCSANTAENLPKPLFAKEGLLRHPLTEGDSGRGSRRPPRTRRRTSRRVTRGYGEPARLRSAREHSTVGDPHHAHAHSDP